MDVYKTIREAVHRDAESETSEDSDGSKGDDAEDEDEKDSDHENDLTVKVPAATPSKDEEPAAEAESGTLRAVVEAATALVAKVTDDEAASIASTADQALSGGPSSLSSQVRQTITSAADGTLGEKGSLLKAISGLWTVRGGEAVPLLEYPVLPAEHVFADSNIIVREDEPSSIIAFMLSSRNYREKLRLVKQQSASSTGREKAESGDEMEHMAWQTPAESLPVEDKVDLEASLKRQGGTHFQIEFESGSTRFFCRIFFAEQFDALRRSSGCTESIIESLSRCVKWDSSGGKSGSAFLKTRDDRLIVKQLSRYEVDGFSKFAPAYFDYMANCFYHDRPTTLAKILGCFRIGFKNSQTGKSLKLDCLVMEHLFYGRETTQIFDLKGSMRNRLVQQTGKANEVLQDENLVEMAHQNPFFVREHSKRTLRAALWNDSLFLADMNVMDYSLVVGIDSVRGKLIVGIIGERCSCWRERGRRLTCCLHQISCGRTPGTSASRALSRKPACLVVRGAASPPSCVDLLGLWCCGVPLTVVPLRCTDHATAIPKSLPRFPRSQHSYGEFLYSRPPCVTALTWLRSSHSQTPDAWLLPTWQSTV